MLSQKRKLIWLRMHLLYSKPEIYRLNLQGPMVELFRVVTSPLQSHLKSSEFVLLVLIYKWIPASAKRELTFPRGWCKPDKPISTIWDPNMQTQKARALIPTSRFLHYLQCSLHQYRIAGWMDLAKTVRKQPCHQFLGRLPACQSVN